MAKASILYISYDGMLEPLGQSQVISYLEHLAGEADIHLLSFEKPQDWHNADMRAAVSTRLNKAGIHWHPLRYHKSPSLLATIYDIVQGIVVALWLCLRHKVKLVHARSYIPALIGLFAKNLDGAKLLFDMRGLWADERTDGGIWPVGGRIYRTVKWLERRLLLRSDHIITLTHASEHVIRDFPYMKGQTIPISVIPTCADLDRFALPVKGTKLDQLVLGYLGSIGTWYMFDEVLECFKLIRAREPNAKMLVVNRLEQDLIRTKLAQHGIEESACEITSAAHADVPAMIARMSVGAAIIKPVFSKIASAPTKLAEYLGCGIPCLGNVGVGDMEMILEDEGAGVALTDFSPEDRQRAVDRLFDLLAKPDLATHCRAVALKHFSLTGGVESYRGIYRELLA